MQRNQTSNGLFKYEIVPQERQLLTILLEDRYKTITGNIEEVNRKRLEQQIELECLKRGKKRLSYQTLRRLGGLESGTFNQDTMDSVLAFLDMKSFDDLNLCMQNIMGEQASEKRPLNVISFLWPHIICLEFKNKQKLKLQYISGDNFEVLYSTLPDVKQHNRLVIYQLIINQGLECEIQDRIPHPEFINMDDSVWLYTSKSKFDSNDYLNPVAKISFEERSAKFSEAKGDRKNHVKDILIPTENRINPLDKLPANADALWYCSAGTDLRSPVFFSKGYLNILFETKNIALESPQLFVFNCLGKNVTELKNKLKKGDFVELFRDGGSSIIGKNYREYTLNKEKVDFKISPSNFNMGFLPELDPNAQAFYFEVTVNSRYYSETHPILYFEMENHNFFQQVVMGQYFNVKYFCATQEGVAFGGNKRSMVKHIYEKNNPLHYAQKGFKPELILHSGGQANGALCFAEENTDLKLTPNYVEYFSRERLPAKTYKSKFWGVTKIDYAEIKDPIPLKYPVKEVESA